MNINLKLFVLANALLFTSNSWAIPVIPIGGSFTISTIYEGSGSSNGSAPLLAVGDSIEGIGFVNTILDANNVVVWNSASGDQLAVIFKDYLAVSLSSQTAPAEAQFTGGKLDIYSTVASLVPTGNFTNDEATILGAQSGLFLSTEGASAGLADPLVTLDSFISAGTLANIGAGSGLGFLNVTGGSQAGNIVKGAVQGKDLSLASSFNSDTTNGYAVSGSLTLKSLEATTVPEPGSLALLGIGLLGFAASSVLRKKA
ncbi:MAG: PEP-CTERM sorting domain-containing protein [Nitrosospira sp.]